jgi:hypothetical protein
MVEPMPADRACQPSGSYRHTCSRDATSGTCSGDNDRQTRPSGATAEIGDPYDEAVPAGTISCRGFTHPTLPMLVCHLTEGAPGDGGS